MVGSSGIRGDRSGGRDIALGLPPNGSFRCRKLVLFIPLLPPSEPGFASLQGSLSTGLIVITKCLTSKALLALARMISGTNRILFPESRDA
jgi:hypothetical protein